jgi:transcriptional regulator with XRE-family HTH domain
MARTPKSSESVRMAKAVGREVRKRRLAAGYSQERLAEVLGIHRTQVGFVERGENTTSIHTLALIATRLGTKASEILHATGY